MGITVYLRNKIRTKKVQINKKDFALYVSTIYLRQKSFNLYGKVIN